MFIWLVFPTLKDPANDFVARKGTLIKVQMERTVRDKYSVLSDVSLLSSSGLKVRLSYRTPLDKTGTYPLVFILGGHQTGRKAVQLLPVQKALVLASISYPYTAPSKLKGLDWLFFHRAFQQAFRDTPPAVMLALEYLQQQDEIDKQHIEAVGVSLGAFLIPAPVAMEQSVKRLWLVQGAAMPEMVIEHNLKNKIQNDFIRLMTAKLFMMMSSGHYLKPERWLAKVSPRPVIAINSRQDERLPSRAVSALHEAMLQPSELIWLEGQHITPRRRDVLLQLSEIILNRIAMESRIGPRDSMAQ